MTKQTVILRTQQNKAYAAGLLSGIKLSDTEPMVMEIKPYRRNRSVEQNEFMWQFLKMVSEETGHTKDELHTMCKHRCLLPILLASGHEEVCKTIGAIDEIKRAGMESQARVAFDMLLDHISTTWLNVKQMTEYLNDIQAFIRNEHGFVMPYREDAA